MQRWNDIHSVSAFYNVSEDTGFVMEVDMGEVIDKLKAAGNKVAGKIKEEVGKATGNERLEAEGDAQQLKGTGQDIKGSVKGALGDKI